MMVATQARARAGNSGFHRVRSELCGCRLRRSHDRHQRTTGPHPELVNRGGHVPDRGRPRRWLRPGNCFDEVVAIEIDDVTDIP